MRSRQKWSSAGVLDFFSPFGARRLRLSRRPCLRAALLLRHLRAEQAQRLRARGIEVHAGVREDLRRNALLLAQQAEQQVLGADVGMAELARFAHGELEHFLRARRVGEVGAGGLRRFPLLDRLLDLLLNLVELDAEILQDGGGDALALADEAEQDVLRPHVFVVETGGFLARHREDLPHPLGEVVAVHSPSERPGWTCS